MSYYTQNECYCYYDEECDVCRVPIELDLKEIAIITVILPVAAVIAPPMMLFDWAKRKISLRGQTG